MQRAAEPLAAREADPWHAQGTVAAKRGYSCAEALAYLGLKRRAFDRHIRPRLPPPTPCGTARVYERIDLDRAWDAFRAAATGRGGEP
jgi:hypothetical protein